MAVPISTVVNVVVAMPPMYPQGVGFSTLLFLGTSDSLPLSVRARQYYSVHQVSADFASTSEEYKAALSFFSQNPRPAFLAIGRAVRGSVGGELLGTSNFESNITVWQSLSPTQHLNLSIDGQAVPLTNLNFASVANLNGVAAVIQAALQSNAPPPQVQFTGMQFLFKSGDSGPSSGVTVTTPTVLSGMLGLTGATVMPGMTGGETVDKALDACEATLAFYGVVLSKDFTDAQALEVAHWTEGHTKVFGHATADMNAKSATSQSDFAATAEGNAFARTLTGYNDPPGQSDYLMVSVLARELAVDFSQPNSTIVMMFRQCPGVAPSNVNLNDKQVLDAKNCNYYTTFGAYPMFATGVMANGTWMDQRHGLDFMAQHLADAMFGGIVVVNKIPQTDKGMAYLTGLLDVAMQDMVNCGLVAPGWWKGTGIANVVNTGEYLPNGYKIYGAPIASQSEIDRMARKAPPITIVAKGAGAIQYVDCYVQFEP